MKKKMMKKKKIIGLGLLSVVILTVTVVTMSLLKADYQEMKTYSEYDQNGRKMSKKTEERYTRKDNRQRRNNPIKQTGTAIKETVKIPFAWGKEE